MSIEAILALVALILAFLEMVLWYGGPAGYRDQRRHILLQAAVIILAISLLLSDTGWVK